MRGVRTAEKWADNESLSWENNVDGGWKMQFTLAKCSILTKLFLPSLVWNWIKCHYCALYARVTQKYRLRTGLVTEIAGQRRVVDIVRPRFNHWAVINISSGEDDGTGSMTVCSNFLPPIGGSKLKDNVQYHIKAKLEEVGVLDLAKSQQKRNIWSHVDTIVIISCFILIFYFFGIMLFSHTSYI